MVSHALHAGCSYVESDSYSIGIDVASHGLMCCMLGAAMWKVTVIGQGLSWLWKPACQPALPPLRPAQMAEAQTAPAAMGLLGSTLTLLLYVFGLSLLCFVLYWPFLRPCCQLPCLQSRARRWPPHM